MNILEQIIENKHQEVIEQKKRFNISDFRSEKYFERNTISLRQGILNHPIFPVIAEIKRSSPSAGEICKDFNPADIANAYELNGAAAISVLTDEKYFSGSLDTLKSVRQISTLPLLRKDFIIDEFQIYQAKASGADAVLLIATVLTRSELSELYLSATSMDLECLVELYDPSEIERLDLDKMKLVGINNRDLKTMRIDMNRSISIAKQIPDDVLLVSESGIRNSDDLQRLKQNGIKSALIGEHLMRSGQPGHALKILLDGLV